MSNFAVVGHCKQCGAPIWIPEKRGRPDYPPPITYSCGCHGPTVGDNQEIKQRVEKLEAEVEELKKGQKTAQGKKTLLTD